MTRVLSENENNDIFLAPNGQISISSDFAAVIQLCQSAMEIQLGEAMYSTGKGIPTEASVWGGNPNLQQFELYARKQILSVDGADEVVSFDANISGDQLSYTATIKTIYGEGVISGSV